MTLEGGPGEEDHLLIDSHSGVICTCNETAWTLLQQLKPGATLSQLTDELVAAFAVTEVDARRDSLSFLRRLGAMGCVDEDG